jgi:hypothetical protein
MEKVQQNTGNLEWLIDKNWKGKEVAKMRK